MDCKDGSDEYKCSYIKIDDDKYRKNIVPVKQVGNSQLEFKVGKEVIDIVEINEPQVSNMSSWEQLIFPPQEWYK